MNPDRYARRIEPEVVIALDIDDEQARRDALETIAERAFAFAYDTNVRNDSPDTLTPATVAAFTAGLAALDFTTQDSNPETVAGWIANSAQNASLLAAAPDGARWTWRTRRDERVRDMHVTADGQVRAAGDPFDIGGHPLMYPGQPIGPPEVWINCRCSLTRASLAAAGGPQPGDSGAVLVVVPADPESLAFPDGEHPDELHVTLGYWPEEALGPEVRDALEAFLAVQGVRDPAVKVAGAGRLGAADPPATVLFVEADEIERLRAALVAQLSETPPDMSHPHFVPHMTIGYGTPIPDEYPQGFDLDPDVELWYQGERVNRRAVDTERLADQITAAAEVAAISDKPWDGSASRFTNEQWKRSCLIHVCDGPNKSCHKLPVREPSGAISRAGVHAATGRLGQVDAPASAISAARSKLRGLYRQLGEDAPDSIAAAIPKPANTHDAPGWLTNPRETQRLRTYWTKGEGAAKIRWGTPGDLTRCHKHLEKFVGPYAWGTCNNLHHVVFGFFNPDSGRRGSYAAAMMEAVTAAFAAADLLEEAMLPPASLFADPQLDAPTPLTVRAAGEFNEVFGHLASWDTCHVGMAGQCTTAPRSKRDYAYFRTGEVETEEGPVPVGHITAGTGHADLDMDASETVRHYDHTGTVVADVAAGEDEHGIWIHGISRPGISDDQLYALRAGAPSGDWRTIGTGLELVGALIVNVPGFPIPRTQVASVGEREMALVAAAIVTGDPSARLPVQEIAVAVVDEQERRMIASALAAARRERAAILAQRVRSERIRRIGEKVGS